jgi:peptidoglycan/LPS O-acetylase OafA/YrhL
MMMNTSHATAASALRATTAASAASIQNTTDSHDNVVDVDKNNNSTTMTMTATTTLPPSLVEKKAAFEAVASDPTDRWQPQPDWSIAPGYNEQQQKQSIIVDPLLTSQQCYDGLVKFFLDVFNDDNFDSNKNVDDDHASNHHRWHYNPFTLAVATEASSHLAGLEAVYGQPWIYGGVGLGNMDECPTDLQVCLAGGTGRDSLTFASVCVVSDCNAQDLLAEDFVERLETASFHVVDVDVDVGRNQRPTDREQILQEYITLHRRVAEVGKFLGTGWVCGEYKVDWDVVPTTLYCLIVAACITLSILGTFWVPKYLRRKRRQNQQQQKDQETNMSETVEYYDSTEPSSGSPSVRSISRTSSESDCYPPSPETSTMASASISMIDRYILEYNHNNRNNKTNAIDSSSSSSIQVPPFWLAWDMSGHLKRLVSGRRTETACLDGLKVGSILWVIAAHVMAIQSSTGAGYLNPKDFLPPHGITTTLVGQLLFSSRFAVDTFLCISGYLAMYVLQRKLIYRKGNSNSNTTTTPWLKIFAVLALRILRILPLYTFCLGFWMFIAPHLGSGPFWYQWENFLEPCRHSWWTNLLFVNNFLPWGISTTANCFYHSWYLAVDVQLFFLFSPWLVLLYQRSTNLAIRFTVFLWTASVVVTAILSYTQMWSVNTFDGAQVALFDVEGYAKPHVRAQSYLAGILVAMWPRRRDKKRNHAHRSTVSSESRPPTLIEKTMSWFRHDDTWLTVLCLICLTCLSFVTVTGAYSRRACTFEELPAYNDCGSVWSPTATFLYTAFSRALWSICIALLMHLCLEDYSDSNCKDEDDETASESYSLARQQSSGRGYATTMVKNVLSWNIWTPLAHLSFGAYLIHPIVIFVWKLGGREKVTFRLSSYVMDCCSISVVTFLLSLGTALLVEFPSQQLLVLITRRKTADRKALDQRKIDNGKSELLQKEISPLVSCSSEYGSIVGRNELD